MGGRVVGDAKARAQAVKPTPVIAVAIPLGLTATITTIALSIEAGPVSFAIPAVLGAGLVLIVRRKLALLGMTHDSTLVVAGIIFGLSALFAVSGLQVEAKRRERDEAARHIVALGRNDPDAQKAQLAKLDDDTLAALGKIAPNLVSQERARRAAEIEREKEEKLAAMRRANAAKTASLLKQLKDLPPDDVEVRLSVYRQLFELDPGQGEYARMVSELNDKLERQRTVREHPERALTLQNYEWAKGGFGSVMLLNATVKNVSDVAVKDFRIYCEHTAPSGTVVDSNTEVAYERVGPGETKRLRNFNMGFIATQSAWSSCTITNAVLAD